MQWKKLRTARRASAQESTSETAKLNTLSLSLPDASGRSRSTPEVTLAQVEKVNRTPTDTTTFSTFALPQAIGDRTRERSQDRRLDPLGLQVVHDPEEEPLLDIILVHGLGGTSRATWSKNRDPEKFWPQQWLPLDPDIQHARILSFGYNAHFASTGPTPITDISDFAKDLLYGMKFAGSESTQTLGIGKVVT